MVRQRDFFDARKRGDRAGYTLIQGDCTLRSVIPGRRKNCECDDALRVESRIDMAQRPKAAHQETRRDQQHQRQRNF